MNDPPHREPQTTQWSLIDRTRDARSSVRRMAMAELVRRYVPALRAHLLYRMKLDDATTDDVVQGFLADRMLEGRLTAGADPGKGRFRSLLVRAIENYAIDVLRRKRREGTADPLAPEFDDHDAIAADPAGVDIFDAAWAREVLLRTLQEMRRECQAQLCEPRWRLFERRVLRPLLEDEPAPAYDVLVQEFQFASPQQASNALVSAKRHFQRVLTEVVGEYAANDTEITGELADLRAIVAAAGPMGLHVGLLDEAPTTEVGSLSDANSCGGELLAALFDDGQDDTPWQAEDYPGLWRHQLAQPLDSVLRAAGPSRQLTEKMITVADLLQRAEPPVAELRRLKETARAYVRAGRLDVPAEIATALYFSAIAAAYAHGRQRITKSDDSVLEHGLRVLLTRTWLDDQTRGLLQSVWSELSI